MKLLLRDFVLTIAAVAGVAALAPTADAQRTCRIVECRQAQVGEVCTVRPCQNGQNLTCVSGRYTVGDGYRTWRGGTQSQCEQRCEDDPNCSLLEYYYGNEGVKCNLYSRFPTIRWNSNYDATICAWN